MKVEYKVRPVTRYVVTKWVDPEIPGVGIQSNSKVIGEFDNFGNANLICSAVARDTVESPADARPESGPFKVFYTLYSPDYQLDDIKVEVV